MLQRKGSRVKAGLEEDALERSVSQSLSVSLLHASLSLCTSAAMYSNIYALLWILLCEQTFKMSSNKHVNQSHRQLRAEEKRKDMRAQDEGKRQGP